MSKEGTVTDAYKPERVQRLCDELARRYAEEYDAAWGLRRRGEPVGSTGGGKSDPTQHTAVGADGEIPDWLVDKRRFLTSVGPRIEAYLRRLRGPRPGPRDTSTPVMPPDPDLDLDQQREYQRRRRERGDT